MDNHLSRKKATPRESRFTGQTMRDEGQGRKMYYDSALHALLVERLPEFVQGGRIAVARLAEEMGFSAFRIYFLLKENRLSVRALNSLVKISDSRDRPEGRGLTKEDLVSFLLN